MSWTCWACGTLGALARLVGHPLALFEGPVARGLDLGEVHKQVLTAIGRGNEPKALVSVEPLYDAFRHAASTFFGEETLDISAENFMPYDVTTVPRNSFPRRGCSLVSVLHKAVEVRQETIYPLPGHA